MVVMRVEAKPLQMTCTSPFYTRSWLLYWDRGSSEEGCTCRCKYATLRLQRFTMAFSFWCGLTGIGWELNYIPCQPLCSQKGFIDIVQVLVKFDGIRNRGDVQSVVRW